MARRRRSSGTRTSWQQACVRIQCVVWFYEKRCDARLNKTLERPLQPLHLLSTPARKQRARCAPVMDPRASYEYPARVRSALCVLWQRAIESAPDSSWWNEKTPFKRASGHAAACGCACACAERAWRGRTLHMRLHVAPSQLTGVAPLPAPIPRQPPAPPQPSRRTSTSWTAPPSCHASCRS